MTDLEKLKQTFDDLGIKYVVTENTGSVPTVRDREIYVDSNGVYCVRLLGPMEDFQFCLDTKGGVGHAQMLFYFDLHQKIVTYAGYEE